MQILSINKESEEKIKALRLYAEENIKSEIPEDERINFKKLGDE